jgi:hypothetical protein
LITVLEQTTAYLIFFGTCTNFRGILRCIKNELICHFMYPRLASTLTKRLGECLSLLLRVWEIPGSNLDEKEERLNAFHTV